MEKVEVRVVAFITQDPNGLGVVLQEVDKQKRKLVIMIGPFEMQGIVVFMKNIPTPRPMTYDLIVNILNELGHTVEEATITNSTKTAPILPLFR